MSVFSALRRLVERLIVPAIAAIFGGIAGMVALGGKGDGAAIGAAIGVILVIIKWAVFGICRGVAKRTSSAELGTIVAITSQPPPGAPWYHHTYVQIESAVG